MSYKATNWAYDLPILGPQKFVLVALADMADEAGSCYPSHSRLSQMTGLSASTVKRALERLEEGEYIRRERRHDKNGYRTSDRYYLALDRTGLEPTGLEVTLPTGQSAYKAESTHLEVTLHTPRGQSDLPKNHQLNHQENHQGGAERPAPFCSKHPKGTTKNCRACGDARRAHDDWTPPPSPPRYPRDVYCEHGQFIGKCWVCDEEQRRAAAILAEQFGAHA